MNTDAHSLEFHLADEEATSELGARLARALDSVKSEILKKGLNIKLVGDLGAGKTYLMRSALRALGFEGRVKSPTFSLLETYKVDGFTVNHFDFYRFEDPVEFEEAGFRENYGPGRVVASEWTSKAEPFVPQPDLTITLKNEGEGRVCDISANSALGNQVLEVLKNNEHSQVVFGGSGRRSFALLCSLVSGVRSSSGRRPRLACGRIHTHHD